MIETKIHMFFEGPEKKIEIGVGTKGPNLCELGPSFWAERVQEAGAVILSTISNRELVAHLLSESSLFVYPHRVVMITCGRTNLAAAAETMLRAWSKDVDFFIYERKNEHFPEYQPTSFLNDAQRLANLRPAQGQRFGSADGHRIQILSSTDTQQPDPEERTLEVLMHGIHPEAAAMFGRERARGPRFEAFKALFQDFIVDEHWFEPTGYSLNAIRGPHYLTIHVTPEQIASYVSFETNLPFGESAQPWVQRVRDVFAPQALDVMTFSSQPLEPLCLDEHHTVGWTEDRLPCGYWVSFRHLERVRQKPEAAYRLPLTAETT